MIYINYEEFENHKIKVNGALIYFVLKTEIDALRDAIINKHRISKKRVMSHLRKSKLAKLNRVFEVIAKNN